MSGVQQSPPTPGAGPTESQNEALTVEEVIDRHYGEWVVIRVVDLDEEGWPLRGRVLVHSPRQEDLVPLLEQEANTADGNRDPRALYYSFRAYPFLRSGQAYEAAIAAFAADLLTRRGSQE